MTASSPAATRRLVLIPSVPRAGRSDASVRRFRLARLRLEERDTLQAPRAGQRGRAGA